MTDCLQLRSGALCVSINPRNGGSIRSFTVIFESAQVALVGSSRSRTEGQACFPMVPFCNRIAQRRFRNGTASVLLPAVGEVWTPHALHGVGWLSPWQVKSSNDQQAIIEHTHDGSVWPWPYLATQEFSISDEELSVTLSLQNRGTSPMPFGLGFHPYFPKPTGTKLAASLSGVWQTSSDMLPSVWKSFDDTDEFDGVRVLDHLAFDNCFTGWNGCATIIWPNLPVGLSMTTEPAVNHLQLYMPANQDFVCVEPMTHMPDAFNRQLASPMLEPDNVAVLSMSLRILEVRK